MKESDAMNETAIICVPCKVARMNAEWDHERIIREMRDANKGG